MEPEMQTQQKPSQDPRQLYVVWGAIVVAIAAIVASFLIIRGAGANADYICTHIIEENGDCANGSWSGWQTVSTSNDTAACAVTKIEKRVYTGTRTTRHILQYLNRRTACDAGYTQTSGGSGGGASGFKSGTIVTESTACQIEETRTTRNPGTGAGCNPNEKTTETASTMSDIGTPNQQTAGVVSGKGQLTEFRISMIAANIYAKPSVVRTGNTTVVKWQSRETTACTVVGSNGDTWDGTAGERTSGPIKEVTTFKLTCTAFNGETVTDEATVTIAPVFQEL